MKHIHFIINPIAGSGKNELNLDYLHSIFEKENFNVVIKNSDYKTHAKTLTKASIEENADIIVACGGDGTINEVANALVNTTIPLGIIPLGSGNGLASNLKIPIHTKEALLKIKKQSITQIDVGVLNGHYFFSNSGIGFDANVVEEYEKANKRKLSSYIRASLKTFKNYKFNTTVELKIKDESFIINPFMIFVSNSNELGYKVSLTPKASLHDGLLDVLIIPKINKIKIILLALLMLLKKTHLLNKVKHYQVKSISILNKEKPLFTAQIDGEMHTIENKNINISVLENGLNVIV